MRRNKFFLRNLLALALSGAIMTGSMSALALDVNDSASSSDTVIDEDEASSVHDEAWFLENCEQLNKAPKITGIKNDNEGVVISTDILDPYSSYSSIGINTYCSKNGGEYKLLTGFQNSLETPYDAKWYAHDDYYLLCDVLHRRLHDDSTEDVWLQGPTADSPVENGNLYQYKVVTTFRGKEIQTSEPSDQIYYLSEPETTLNSLNSGRTLKISWNRNSKADGYKIRYTTSSFRNSSSIKRRTVKGNWKTSLTLNKRTPRKYYKVQVRSYKKINGKTYYSAWSTVAKCLM